MIPNKKITTNVFEYYRNKQNNPNLSTIWIEQRKTPKILTSTRGSSSSFFFFNYSVVAIHLHKVDVNFVFKELVPRMCHQKVNKI